jgi:anti-sigma regulatory factor (Ser/Thr protein kinase)
MPVHRDRVGLLATLSLWSAAAPNAAGAARGALTALEAHVDDETAYQLQLVVTELVTNSVRHSGLSPAGAVGLDVRVAPDRLFVEVSDPGPGFEPEVCEATPDDLDRTGGWGLLLVDQLTDSWGVVRDDLTRVRFEMSLEHAA